MVGVIFIPSLFIKGIYLQNKWYYNIALHFIDLTLWGILAFDYIRLKNQMISLHKFEYEKNIKYMRTVLIYVIVGKIAFISTLKMCPELFD